MTEVYGICGTHSTGKSILAHRTALLAKQAYPNRKIGFISETARETSLTHAADGVNHTQMNILARQLKQESERRAANDIVITDRTFVDIFAYSSALSADAPLLGMIEKLIAGYPYSIIYYTEPTNEPAIADGVRFTDEEFRLKIDSIIRRCLRTKLPKGTEVQTVREHCTLCE